MAYVAVDHVHHCPHVTVVSVESSGDIYIYDNVTPGNRMRLNSIIDLIPYVFENYRTFRVRVRVRVRVRARVRVRVRVRIRIRIRVRVRVGG